MDNINNHNQQIAENKGKGDVVEGVIIEALPNILFRVKLATSPDEKEILAYLSGKMRINRIRVLVGDRVSLLLDSYGGKARIIKRL